MGDSTVLFPRVTLYESTRVGSRVRIHAGAVLGSDGFGYSPKKDEISKQPLGHQKIYHLGCVHIEDDVEIGANSCIDRGTIGETRIGRYSKLDNLVHIGHNARLDEGAVICGGTCLAGNASVGRYAYVGGLSGIGNHVHVGDGAKVGALTMVTKDVANASSAVGNPQRDAKEHFRAHALLSVGTRVVALKCVTVNEPYFQGHFPGFAIVPGVLIIETMAQTASFSVYPSIAKNIDRLAKDFRCILVGVDGARFRKPVVPGDCMRIETEAQYKGAPVNPPETEPISKFKGELKPENKPEHKGDAKSSAKLETPSASSFIHPTAIIHPSVVLDPSTQVGPWCTIGPHVRLGKGNRLLSHVVIEGATEIGDGNTFYPFSVIGGIPQDLKYKGEPTRLVIGNHNTFREAVTLNLGTVKGGGVTQIGNHCLIMAYTHIGHDCILGNYCIIANYGGLAGHVVVEDYVTMGGQCGITQFTRIGAHAYLGGQSAIERDIPPFVTAVGGRPCSLKGTNIVGLRRRGFSLETIQTINEAIKLWMRPDIQKEQCLLEIEAQYGETREVREFVTFIRQSETGVLR
ncbi:unnamed protein product [Sphagnum tenellum]